MILTCPACGTQYVVKDGAIPAGGRKVRCASCRHSWHQEAEPLELSPEAEVEPAETDVARDEPIPTDASAEGDFHDRSSVADDGLAGTPDDDEPTYADYPAPHAGDDYVDALRDEPNGERHEQVERPSALPPPIEPEVEYGQSVEDVEQEDEFSPFARREMADEPKGRPWLKLLFLLALIAGLAAAFWFFAPPEWKSRVGLAAGPDTPLQLMMTHSDRQRLASGNELLAVSGRVINPTSRRQSVPPIKAELRNSAGKLVYSWTITPPARSLEPGASATFNSAEVNVPAGGEELTVSLGAPRA